MYPQAKTKEDTHCIYLISHNRGELGIEVVYIAEYAEKGMIKNHNGNFIKMKKGSKSNDIEM